MIFTPEWWKKGKKVKKWCQKRKKWPPFWTSKKGPKMGSFWGQNSTLFGGPFGGTPKMVENWGVLGPSFFDPFFQEQMGNLHISHLKKGPKKLKNGVIFELRGTQNPVPPLGNAKNAKNKMGNSHHFCIFGFFALKMGLCQDLGTILGPFFGGLKKGPKWPHPARGPFLIKNRWFFVIIIKKSMKMMKNQFFISKNWFLTLKNVKKRFWEIKKWFFIKFFYFLWIFVEKKFFFQKNFHFQKKIHEK